MGDLRRLRILRIRTMRYILRIRTVLHINISFALR
jgi:hypothetical protein